jgi:hypothetical protein
VATCPLLCDRAGFARHIVVAADNVLRVAFFGAANDGAGQDGVVLGIASGAGPAEPTRASSRANAGAPLRVYN